MRLVLPEQFRPLLLQTGARRQILAALIAAALAKARIDDAAGKRGNRKRKRCRGGKKRCGRRCVPGTCCPGKSCGSAEPNCRCGRTVEGRGFCQTGGVIVVIPCASSADCDPGEACIQEAGGELKLCVPPCGVAA